MSDPKIFYVGVDDGYAETKIAFGSGERFRIPSHARAGQSHEVSLVGQDTKASSYLTDDGEFIAGDLDRPDPTAFDEYPVSAQNRVIVAHALRAAGVPLSMKLCICSGLPVKRFYKGKEPNRELIIAKKQNLLRNDVRALPGRTRMHEIIRHEVAAEGVGAYWDFILERKDSGSRPIQNKEKRALRTAIVDVGGRTTDIAVIRNMSLDMDRSSTIEMGMLTVMRKVADSLNGEFSAELNSEQIEQAIKTGFVTVWNESQDVSAIVESAMKSTIESIKTEVKRRLGNAADINHILMVGGAIEQGRRHFEGWYKNQTFIDQPGFANASGFQKYAEMTMSAPVDAK